MDQSHRIAVTWTRRHANPGITLSDEESSGENAHRAAVLLGDRAEATLTVLDAELGDLGPQSLP